MLATSVTVQFVFAWQLVLAHVNDFKLYRDDICSVYFLLHICAILVFCVLMLNNVPNMWRAGMIALTSTRHKNGDGDAIGELIEETLASSLSPHLVTPCNTLQHPATPCNTRQHPATPCNTRQHTATPCNTAHDYCTALLQRKVTRCNTLQCTATYCNTLQHPAT